jgi:hypothetical protein
MAFRENGSIREASRVFELRRGRPSRGGAHKSSRPAHVDMNRARRGFPSRGRGESLRRRRRSRCRAPTDGVKACVAHVLAARRPSRAPGWIGEGSQRAACGVGPRPSAPRRARAMGVRSPCGARTAAARSWQAPWRARRIEFCAEGARSAQKAVHRGCLAAAQGSEAARSGPAETRRRRCRRRSAPCAGAGAPLPCMARAEPASSRHAGERGAGESKGGEVPGWCGGAVMLVSTDTPNARRLMRRRGCAGRIETYYGLGTARARSPE